VERSGITDLLVVAGDGCVAPCADALSGLEYITLLTKARPELRVFAALDQYRQSMDAELRYCAEKLCAGASGFFTQPFFDVVEMERWEPELDEGRVWFGISPVLSERSREYWVTRNKVVFPVSFQPTLEWNRAFLRDALQFVRERKANAYVMPIKADLGEYLDGIIE
jgi:methylenetetrahydrofolate reductase (NADPH)